MTPLTGEQIDFAIGMIAKYMRVVLDETGHFPSEIDVEHSSLLPRLLSGKPALTYPPPKAYSQPCYDMAEGKEVQMHDDPREYTYLDDTPRVNICQNINWKWQDKEQGILCFIPRGDLYKYSTREVTRKNGEKYTGHFIQLLRTQITA